MLPLVTTSVNALEKRDPNEVGNLIDLAFSSHVDDTNYLHARGASLDQREGTRQGESEVCWFTNEISTGIIRA